MLYIFNILTIYVTLEKNQDIGNHTEKHYLNPTSKTILINFNDILR